MYSMAQSLIRPRDLSQTLNVRPYNASAESWRDYVRVNRSRSPRCKLMHCLGIQLIPPNSNFHRVRGLSVNRVVRCTSEAVCPCITAMQLPHLTSAGLRTSIAGQVRTVVVTVVSQKCFAPSLRKVACPTHTLGIPIEQE